MTSKKEEPELPDDLGTTDPKKAYEAPELIELGSVSELTNYDVSVKVGTRKERDDHEA